MSLTTSTSTKSAESFAVQPFMSCVQGVAVPTTFQEINSQLPMTTGGGLGERDCFGISLRKTILPFNCFFFRQLSFNFLIWYVRRHAAHETLDEVI